MFLGKQVSEGLENAPDDRLQIHLHVSISLA